jgi:hypothetical protein
MRYVRQFDVTRTLRKRLSNLLRLAVRSGRLSAEDRNFAGDFLVN